MVCQQESASLSNELSLLGKEVEEIVHLSSNESISSLSSSSQVLTAVAMVHHRGKRNTTSRTSPSRTRRDIFHLYNMMSCTTQCDPLVYKGYGCYCGFLGSGLTVDAIDRYIIFSILAPHLSLKYNLTFYNTLHTTHLTLNTLLHTCKDVAKNTITATEIRRVGTNRSSISFPTSGSATAVILIVVFTFLDKSLNHLKINKTNKRFTNTNRMLSIIKQINQLINNQIRD